MSAEPPDTFPQSKYYTYSYNYQLTKIYRRVAAWRPSGRAADIFSLGCVFVEILCLHRRGSLDHIRRNRSADPSFHANIDKLPMWLHTKDKDFASEVDHPDRDIILMLSTDPVYRPPATQLLNKMATYDRNEKGACTLPLFSHCCKKVPAPSKKHAAMIAESEGKIQQWAKREFHHQDHYEEEMQHLHISMSEIDELVSKAAVRFGALMTSKWLSNGCVLFSLAHFDLNDPTQDRVLVIDSLSQDWSKYCAVTYPGAVVYALGPGPTSRGALDNHRRNHRHVCHDDLSNAFPFPMHFFAVVILRYPTVHYSLVYRFVLSEMKRVLRPGGYIEFSTIDLDLVNPGDRTHRAIRELKMRMQTADETLSLRNISDELLRNVSDKGFIDCSHRVVELPISGKLHIPDLPSNEDIAATENDSNANSTAGFFSNILNITSLPESTGDNITTMVARVGRWWFSNCYESLALHKADKVGASTSGNLGTTIWDDEYMLRDCDKHGTRFKLLVGYARKPGLDIRHTRSSELTKSVQRLSRQLPS